MWYLTIPIITWIACGSLKFVCNFIRFGAVAFKRIGHGGFPSNHTAIVSSVMWSFLLAKQWEIATLASAVLMIYIFDATGLRREIGAHAVAINKLIGTQCREIVGHTPFDIAGGLAVGLAIAVAYHTIGLIP